jgi:hypothetical protein
MATTTASHTSTATPTASRTETRTTTVTATSTPPVTPAGCGATIRSSTVGGVNHLNGYNCYVGDESGPDHLYALSIVSPGSIRATLTGMSADLDAFILNAPAPSACTAYGDYSAYLPYATAGTYYIAVDGFNGAAGSYVLDIACDPAGTTGTPTRTVSPTVSPSRTRTASPTVSPSRTRTASPTVSPSRTVTATPTVILSPTVTATPTQTRWPYVIYFPIIFRDYTSVF